MSEEPRFAPNGNKLPERLPVGHRLVDTTKQQWIIGPSIGCGGFGDIYLTRQYDEKRDDLKRFNQEQIIKESQAWSNVIKFEHFSGPLFAEINFYLRCARRETIEEYMTAKKLKHLGMPRFVASGIYDPLRDDNPPPVCKNTTIASSNGKPPPAKRGRLAGAAKNGTTNGVQTNGVVKKTNGAVNGRHKKLPNSSNQTKEKKYRFLVLERFGDDVQKIWQRAHEHFDMKSAFTIALKVLDTLEYIHSHGYVHADVKASNLLIDWRGDSDRSHSKDYGNNNSIAPKSQNGVSTPKTTAVKRERPKSVTKSSSKTSNGASSLTNKSSIEPEDQIYLVDFGLVERFYSKDGTHREHVEDQRRANNGTVEFSSRDAHIGAFSRRSDLESLAYNLLYWVSGGRLPWTNCLKDHQLVEASKKWYMSNLEVFVNYCFNEDAIPIDPLKLLRGQEVSPTGTVTTNGIKTPTTSTKSSRSSSKSSTKSSVKSTTKSARSVSSSKSSSLSSSTSTDNSIMCAALYDILSYISKLSFEDEPDYFLLKSILGHALGGGSSARTARKVRGVPIVKKTPPKLPKCENPTPAMREILRKMTLTGKKR
uniref:non-specific serine/threonine protein kinase n=1 Tax=Aceria tosichella TaxID=561515 RepID=A0A6G1S572_9ACAR